MEMLLYDLVDLQVQKVIQAQQVPLICRCPKITSLFTRSSYRGLSPLPPGIGWYIMRNIYHNVACILCIFTVV